MDGYVAKIIAHDSRVTKAIITWQGILQLLEAMLRIENFENDVTVVANFDNGEGGLRDGVNSEVAEVVIIVEHFENYGW